MKILRYLVLFILLAGCFPAFGYKHHTIPQMKQYLRMSKDPRKQEKWRNLIREARGKRGKSSRNRYVGGYSYPHWYEYVPAPGGKSYYPNKSYEKLQALRTPEQIKAQTERVKAELHTDKEQKTDEFLKKLSFSEIAFSSQVKNYIDLSFPVFLYKESEGDRKELLLCIPINEKPNQKKCKIMVQAYDKQNRIHYLNQTIDSKFDVVETKKIHGHLYLVYRMPQPLQYVKFFVVCEKVK